MVLKGKESISTSMSLASLGGQVQTGTGLRGRGESGSLGTDLLHRVVHREQRLHPPALQHVGELHVDGLHGPRVA